MNIFVKLVIQKIVKVQIKVKENNNNTIWILIRNLPTKLAIKEATITAIIIIIVVLSGIQKKRN
jgi:hypothetical protein